MKEQNLNKLSSKDRAILAILQKEGRLSNVELAKRVNLSPSPCLERVRRLEQQGFISRYKAVLNPEKLDLAMIAYIEVTLSKTSRAAFSEFVADVSKIDEIVECHMVAGGFDFLLKVRVKDMSHYRHLLSEVLVDLPHLGQTHTYVVIEQNKETTDLPI